MSRVSYVMMNPGGDAEMTKAVRDALNILAANVAKEAGVGLREILEVTFVGNPIMHHLLLGIDPTELGGAPFALATDGAITIWASEIELRVHPNARIFVLPCIAGHVGADTAGVILSEAPHQSDEMTLIVDVGTNAEIVLGNRHKLVAASSPTGPAFEGAQISCGQRAAPGAVERVRIDPETLEPRFKVIGSRQMVERAGFRRGDGGDRHHRGLRLRHHRGSGRDVSWPASSPGTGWWTAAWRRARRASSRRAEPSPICSMTAGRGPAGAADHPERRPGDPAGQGGALCRGAAAHGPSRDRPARPHHPGGGLRQPYRRQIRHDPGDDSRLRPVQGAGRPGTQRERAPGSPCST